MSSAGGSILNADSSAPSLGQPAIDAVQAMRDLVPSGTADPSLSNSHAFSPRGKQNPSSVISSLHGQIDDALNSMG